MSENKKITPSIFINKNGVFEVTDPEILRSITGGAGTVAAAGVSWSGVISAISDFLSGPSIEINGMNCTVNNGCNPPPAPPSPPSSSPEPSPPPSSPSPPPSSGK